MPDPRWETLADILINHSTRLAARETLLIECFDLEDDSLPRLLVRKAARKGAYPLIELKSNRLTLSSAFRRADWHTAAVMPATNGPWPEGKFYRYDQVYASQDHGLSRIIKRHSVSRADVQPTGAEPITFLLCPSKAKDASVTAALIGCHMLHDAPIARLRVG